MKTIATIFTIIASLLYLITTYLLINDPIGKSDKTGAHLLNFFIWFTIPIILWVVYFIMNEIKKTNSKTASFTNKNSNATSYIYHTHINGSTSEPLTYNQLKAKSITKNTYVWRNGIDWMKAGELRELRQLFEQNNPPPFDIEKEKLKINEKNTRRKHLEIQIIVIIIILAGILLSKIVETIGYPFN